jgi:CTP:molybdopterin cytidylyltransferase MocA
MTKSTVALLLARGTAEAFKGNPNLKYKALLPVKGRPLADYVLRSLQNSLVEKIFIVQSPDARLQDVLTAHSKNVFLDIAGNQHSLAWSLAKALEKLVEHYKTEDLKRLLIMLTPCDIPLVGAEDINELILQAQSQQANLILTMVPYGLVKQAYPHKRFHELFHADIKQKMAIQSIAFVSGESFRAKPIPGPDGFRLTVVDAKGYPIPGLDKAIDLLRQERRSIWLWPGLMHQVFVRRLIARGRCIDICRMVTDMLFRKVTVDRIRYYLLASLGIDSGVVCSRTAKFSFDIDTYQDLELI